MTFHYSHGSNAASFVELVGNAAVVSGTALSADAVNLFGQPGAFPLSCLPAVLHESAHHYCFAMPVGRALSTCYLEAARSYLDDVPGAVSDDHLAEALIRYDFVTHMLRPLAEGIALYAEFDATPFMSPARISPPLSDVCLLFGQQIDAIARDNATTVRDALDELLFQERIGGATPARRQMVLMEPLIDDADGYLTGYWLVKNWRLHLLATLGAKPLEDTDFHLQFIANFFYGDLHLANMILDFTHYRVRNLAGLLDGQEDFCTVFLHYFKQRLKFLLIDLTAADIDRVETALADPVGYRFDAVQVPSPGCTATGGDAFAATVRHYAQKFSGIREEAIGAALVQLLDARRWMAYASFDTTVRVAENGRIWVGEGEHPSSESLPVLGIPRQFASVVPGAAEGVIELVHDRNADTDHFRWLVWRGTELVADMDFYSTPRADPEDTASGPPCFSSSAIRKIVRRIDRELREALAGMSCGSVVADDCMSQLVTLRADMYATHVCAFIPGHDAGIAALRAPFPWLCGNDIAALRIAAAIGTLTGGIVSVNSGCWNYHRLETLLACPLPVAFRLGQHIYFRV